MKRFSIAGLVCLLLIGILGGCTAPWSTVMMEEVLPSILDEFTWEVRVEAVTVIRASDGASATVSGTDVELLYAGFVNTACTRRSGAVTPVYTLQFTMREGLDAVPDVTVGEFKGSICCAVGEYRYRPVTVEFDLSYLNGLFS